MLVLAIAVNFEPTRLGLITLMLTGQHPVRHLLAFFCAAFVTSATAGLLVLFVFHRGFLASVDVDASVVQIVIGAVIVLIAAVLTASLATGRRKAASNVGAPMPAATEPAAEKNRPSRLGGLSTTVKAALNGRRSPWLSGLAGAGLAMPNVDYMALLALIIASKASAGVQTAALFTFLVIANLVTAVPLISYRIAPEKTNMMVQNLNTWVRCRSRRDVAVFLALTGSLLIALGVASA